MNNIYDDEGFFCEYSNMARSRQGLAGAGEWKQFRALFPDLKGKSVLDLGCGFGWHCRHAIEQGAEKVLGIDLSSKMIDEARVKNSDQKITYRVCGAESYEFPEGMYDCVISNLVLHYIENLEVIYRKVYGTLKENGVFLINIEHPVFTSGVGQDWIYSNGGKPEYWPVDNYFITGERITGFLGQAVKKQHHTLTQILMGLRNAGFSLDAVEEAVPDSDMMSIPGMADELRRPMMLLIKAVKEAD